jgi:HlyD family secretion protein
LNGLKDGEEIITGSYKVIRTLRNDSKIKVDNKAPVKTES